MIDMIRSSDSTFQSSANPGGREWEQVITHTAAPLPSPVRFLAIIVWRIELAPDSKKLVMTTPWRPDYLGHGKREGGEIAETA